MVADLFEQKTVFPGDTEENQSVCQVIRSKIQIFSLWTRTVDHVTLKTLEIFSILIYKKLSCNPVLYFVVPKNCPTEI